LSKKPRKDHTEIELDSIGYASARNAENKTKLENYREIIIKQQETMIGIFYLKNHDKPNHVLFITFEWRSCQINNYFRKIKQV
jgi:hypothetical protein